MVPFLYSNHQLLLSASTFAYYCHFLNVTIEDANVVPQSLWHYYPLTLRYMRSNIISKAHWASNMTHDSKSVNLTHFWRLSICNLFSWNTSHSHDNLRRVSNSPLLHPFTHCRSGTLDWCVMKATSADSSRLIYTILAHSSTSLYLSIFCCHRTLVKLNWALVLHWESASNSIPIAACKIQYQCKNGHRDTLFTPLMTEISRLQD
jgi:hypothetical protein